MYAYNASNYPASPNPYSFKKVPQQFTGGPMDDIDYFDKELEKFVEKKKNSTSGNSKSTLAQHAKEVNHSTHVVSSSSENAMNKPQTTPKE
jgi:hypothetical protein